MNRGASQPWRLQRSTGFDRRGRGPVPRALALVAIVIALVVLAFFALRACGGGCSDDYCATSLDVSPPDGFSFVTDVYELNGEPPAIAEGGTVDITVEVDGDDPTAAGLSFYGYLPEQSAWELLTPARLSEDGKHVTGTFTSYPQTMVVMRRTSAAGQVAAWLDPGQQLHPDADGRITILHTRDFKPEGDGSVSGTLTQVSVPAGASHYPVISANATVDGSLQNLDAILASSTMRSTHVRRIVELTNGLGLSGITLDYRDLRADQRISYGLLVEELGLALQRDGKKLVVVLPAPVRTTERVDEGAYDWTVIAGSADVVEMATIRDQSTYRADLPVILEHLSQTIDLHKVLLTVSPYASERSPEGVRRLTLADAMTIATAIAVDSDQLITSSNVDVVGVNINKNEGLSGIVWDERAGAVGFTYKQDGGRTVWLENSFSVGFKLEFVKVFELGGFAVEDASDSAFLGNIWAGIVPFVDTGEPVLLRPNPEDLSPRWTVSAGTLEGGSGGVARWTTPSEPGTYTINLELSDGVYVFESELIVDVRQPEQPASGG